MLPSFLRLSCGDWIIHLGGYGFPAFCGVLAALHPALRRSRDAGLPLRSLLRVILLTLLGGFAGAKAASFLQTGSWGGRVLYGSLLGGLAVLLPASRAFGLPRLATADVLAPPVLLAAAFGRLGCLFGGCCYGGPWAQGIVYPRGSHAWRSHLAAGWISPEAPTSLGTIPLPLMEAAALFLIAFATSRMARTAVGSGRVLAVAGLLYSIWRFVAEFGRGDHGPYWAATLTFSQGISVLVFAASAALLSRPPLLLSRPPPCLHGPAPLQVALLLLMAVAGSGSLGCSSKRSREKALEAHEKHLEYRERTRDKAKEYHRRAREELEDEAEDCLDECLSDCTEVCCEAMCEAVCEEEEDEKVPPLRPSNVKPETASPAGGTPLVRFRIPVLRPGRTIAARVDLDGMLNRRLKIRVRVETEIEALPAVNEELPFRFRLKAAELSLGELEVKSGPGELELRLNPEGELSVFSSTLDPELASVLRAVEPILEGILRFPADWKHAPAWRDKILREVQIQDAQGYANGRLTWDGHERLLELRAWITETPGGGRRMTWVAR